jgi:hypothetical protein
LIVAARQLSGGASVNHCFVEFVWSGVNGRPAWTALAVEGNFSGMLQADAYSGFNAP